MGNPVSKSQAFMEQRERSNTEYRKQGTLSMNLVRESVLLMLLISLSP